MFYKLSNTAQLKEIESEFNISFEFPKLYKPSTVINGLQESIVPIITMEHPEQVHFGIWGLLPKSLEDNWEIFQNLTNTLNINIEHLDVNNPLYSEALEKRRCLVITTGFFTSALFKGKMYPHHVYLENHRPFSIAGVYNELHDGFITCSILIKKTSASFDEIPHLLDYKPLIFDSRDRKHWLNKEFPFNSLKDLVESHQGVKFRSHPVAKEFYDIDILYDQIIKSESFMEFLTSSN